MIGATVGNFRIVSQLGKGGMGEVWLAEQQSIKTKVAIKLLRADISADDSHVQRFFNEAVAVSKIRHAGIAKIFDVGYLGAQAYLVMEYLEGETLMRRIARAGRLALREVCEIGRQVAGVLDATHAAGIIHRDLKPDNVFLVPDAELPSGERAKVLDFGIAKLGSVGITSTSVGSMGTPLYMSPEQWRSVAKVDGRADAYSLGCVVFEMACGRPPFLAESIGEACAKHLTDPPPAPSSIAPGVPPAFDQLVARLLEKDPAQRPSMKEAMSAFDAIAAGLPATAPAVHAPQGVASSQPLPSAPVSSGAPTVATVGAISAAAPAQTAAPASTTAPADASQPPQPQPQPTPPPPAPQPPPPPDDAPLVSPTAVRRLSGESPKDLRSPVAAQLCIDPAGAVTSVEIGLDVDKKLAADLKQKLETWRYAPYRPDGTAIAVCFQTILQPKPPASPPGSGSGSSKPGGGSGSGSSKPPAPTVPEELGQADFMAVMKNLEPSLRACRKRPLRLTVRMSVRVAPGGTVEHVGLGGGARQGVATCIRRLVQDATFPVTQRGGKLDYELDL